jgi:hypothetical protein
MLARLCARLPSCTVNISARRPEDTWSTLTGVKDSTSELRVADRDRPSHNFKLRPPAIKAAGTVTGAGADVIRATGRAHRRPPPPPLVYLNASSVIRSRHPLAGRSCRPNPRVRLNRSESFKVFSFKSSQSESPQNGQGCRLRHGTLHSTEDQRLALTSPGARSAASKAALLAQTEQVETVE